MEFVAFGLPLAEAFVECWEHMRTETGALAGSIFEAAAMDTCHGQPPAEDAPQHDPGNPRLQRLCTRALMITCVPINSVASTCILLHFLPGCGPGPASVNCFHHIPESRGALHNPLGGAPSQVKSRFSPRGYIEQGATCHGPARGAGEGVGASGAPAA